MPRRLFRGLKVVSNKLVIMYLYLGQHTGTKPSCADPTHVHSRTMRGSIKSLRDFFYIDFNVLWRKLQSAFFCWLEFLAKEDIIHRQVISFPPHYKQLIQRPKRAKKTVHNSMHSFNVSVVYYLGKKVQERQNYWWFNGDLTENLNTSWFCSALC